MDSLVEWEDRLLIGGGSGCVDVAARVGAMTSTTVLAEVRRIGECVGAWARFQRTNWVAKCLAAGLSAVVALLKMSCTGRGSRLGR